MIRGIICFAISLISISAYSQSSSEIFHDIKKLNSFKSVLYMAAHPDDENTRVIAWLENGEMARTGYLSLTRGDGGQNLIGKELGPTLGVLRTQELLAARRIDGGDQFFSRAVDFGYSKSAEESFDKWGREEVLRDAIWVIRKFQPDVIITRFPPDKRAGHGHHTASAMLAIEAYEKAGDPEIYPEQLEFVKAWQPQAVYWNASVWWNKNLDSIAKNNDEYIVADIGGYDKLLGVSYNELGSKARSQHKCQGFGVSIERGERIEYFKHLAGDKLEESFFNAVDRDWSMFGYGNLEELGKQLEEEYDFNDPAASLDILGRMQSFLYKQKWSAWRESKLKEIQALILEISGLHVEALYKEYSVNTNDEGKFSLEIINRSDRKVELNLVTILSRGFDVEEIDPIELPKNQISKTEYSIFFSRETSNAYWLENDYKDIYNIEGYEDLGKPENDAIATLILTFVVDSVPFNVKVPIIYKWSDRVKGEMKRPVSVTPEASVSFLEKSFVFTSKEEKEVNVLVKNYGKEGSADVGLNLPEGWSYSPSSIKVDFEKKYEEHIVSFKIVSPKKASKGDIVISVNGNPAQRVEEVMYDHISAQLVFLPAKATLLNLDIDIEPGKVGYIEGAGDQVAMAIEQMGYEVVYLDKEDLGTQDLLQYQAIITGIRAYNVNPWLTDFHSKFMDYVEGGGNFIIQYNTRSSSYGTDKMGPYPFVISRDRVSEEDAEVKFVDPKHALLNEPNKLELKDFDGWVQERGLYFASDWDNQYQTLLSWHDKDESPKMGALIYATHGEGSFVYTGISFFRELPAGVPGAFKLLANIISHEAE